MAAYENGGNGFDDAVHGIEQMRIGGGGENRHKQQNGASQAARGGRNNYNNNKHPRNGHSQQNRAYSANANAHAGQNGGKPNVSDAQLKTGFALHQDPAIIAFSGANAVSAVPVGTQLMPVSTPIAPAAAGVPPFGFSQPVFPNGNYTEPNNAAPSNAIEQLLPSNYRSNFTNETRARAYGSYVGKSAVPGASQDRRQTGRRPHGKDAQDADADGNHADADDFQGDNGDGELEFDADAQVGASKPGYVINKKGIYVRGLDPSTSDADLRARFEQFGVVVQCKVQTDLQTHACLGYGFVEFADESSARTAIDACANDANRRLEVSMMRMPAPDMTNVYVRNLPLNFQDRDLENLFAAFGQVVSVRILRYPNNVSQGVGFARMSSQSECERIIDTYNGCCLPGSPQPLVVKFADDSSVKRSKQRPERGDRFAPTGGFDRPRQPRPDGNPHQHQHHQQQQHQFHSQQGALRQPAQQKGYAANPHFSARNGAYQQQPGYHHQNQHQHQHHGPQAAQQNAYQPHADVPSFPPGGYVPQCYQAPPAPNGAYSQAYQPQPQPQPQPHSGYYQHPAPPPFGQPVPGSYAGPAPPVGYPPYDQAQGAVYQQAVGGYPAGAMEGGQYAGPGYSNSNMPPPAAAPSMYVYSSSNGEANVQVQGRPNAYVQPVASTPYVDPAIISLRNGNGSK